MTDQRSYYQSPAFMIKRLASLGLTFSLLLPAMAQMGLNLRFLPDQFDAQWYQPAWMLADSLHPGELGGGVHIRSGVYPLHIGQVLSLPSFIDEATKEALVAPLGADNRFDLQTDFTIGINALVGPVTLGLGFRNRVSTYVETGSPNTLGLLLYGNARYAGETISDQDLMGHLATYQEYSLAGAYGGALGDSGRWQVGLRLKVLVGRQFLGWENLSYSLFTEENGRYVDLAGGYRLLETSSSRSPGVGAGVDLGGVVQLNPKLTLQAAILDLGQLDWQGDLREAAFDLRYDGFEIVNAFDATLDDGLELGGPDSLIDQIWADSVDGNLTMALPAQAHLGAQYQLSRSDLILGSVHYGWVPTGLDGALVNVGYQRHFGSIGLVGVNGFVGGQDRYGFGLYSQLNLRFGEQLMGRFFLSADNLSGLLIPDRAYGLALQGGLTISLVAPGQR